MELVKKNGLEELYNSQKDRSLIEYKRRYAEFLEDYNLDEDAAIAALVYDGDLEKIKTMSKGVVRLVEGLNRFNMLAVKAGKRNKEDKIRKMLISTTEDLRVLLIKLLERLYEMRNLDILNELERKRISRDTMEIYAPIAYRLGLSNIKWELEDLAFKYLNFESYFELKQKVGLERKERERIIEELKEKLNKEIKKRKIKAEVFGRAKHFYSIYKKMVNEGKRFEEIYDLMGLRVIVENSGDCYRVLDVVNSLWDTLLGRFKDFIVAPKKNLYQSLHAGFYYKEMPVEVQIRTRKMNDIAEEGVAAHWKYKGIGGEKRFDKQVSWLRQILDLGTESDKEFLYKLKLDLFENKIYCFTPKGDIIELDEGSSVVDFAYAVHSEIGEKCTGARVDGRFVNLRYKVGNGDEIEIITSKVHEPSRDWLGFVKTQKAFERIKQYFSIRGKIAGRRKRRVEEKVSEAFLGVEGNYEVSIAKCCNPLPREEIGGVVSSFKKVMVHSKGCRNVSKVRRLVQAFWIEDFQSKVKIKIRAEERVGLFAEILNAIAAMNINVQSASAQSVSEDIAECILNINFSNLSELKKVVERVKGIQSVKRVRVE